MTSKLEDCPCIKCLVKVQCKSKIVRYDQYSRRVYLIFDYLKKCSYSFDYFFEKSIDNELIEYRPDFFDRVREFCKIHNINGKEFIWVGGELRIYNKRRI